MPFPVGGCQTCRSRHLKCDQTRPTCLNCRKSGRHCAGWRTGTGSLLFLNENIYASTQARRPRGGARWVPEFSADGLSIDETIHDDNESNPAAVSDAIIPQLPGIGRIAWLSTENLNASIPAVLQQPLGELAIGYFAHTYFRNATTSPENIWSLVQTQFQRSRVAGDDALNLAFSALSLVYYGRNNRIAVALTEGRKKYSCALREIRNAIEDSSMALTDEILIAVMVMGSYENSVANFDQQRLLSYSFQHHQGALVLLKFRQEQRIGAIPPISLDQCIRRQVIKSCIYRNVEVPDWLHDGSSFGEEDYQLELDRCFIKLASLRHHFATIFYDSDDTPRLQRADGKFVVEKLISDCVAIFHSLNVWRGDLDNRHHYEVLSGNLSDSSSSAASLFYSTEIHCFRNAANASLWARYHGTRMFTACILIKLLFVWKHIIGDNPDKYSATERMAHADARITANNICAGIPFAFGVDFTTSKDLETIIKQATPAAMNSLNWPMIVLAGSQISNQKQLQWIRDKMLLVSRVTGNATIQTLANVKDFTAPAHQILSANQAQMRLQDHSRIRSEALLEPRLI